MGLFNLPRLAQWDDGGGGFVVKGVLPGKQITLYFFLCSGLIIQSDMLMRCYFDDESAHQDMNWYASSQTR